MLAEWRFNDGSGQQLTDYSGNGYHGTLGATSGSSTDDPTWDASGYLSFDGGDYVTLPTLPAHQGLDIVFYTGSAISAATSAAHLWSHSSDSSQIAFGSVTGALTNEIVSIIQNSPEYTAGPRVAWAHASDTIAAGWHLLQLDFRSGTPTWDIVLDGTNKANVVSSVPAQIVSAAGFFARRSLSASAFFTGRIGYATVYSSARTTAQVAQNRAALKAIMAGRGHALP
jgi:hypothetical protein